MVGRVTREGSCRLAALQNLFSTPTLWTETVETDKSLFLSLHQVSCLGGPLLGRGKDTMAKQLLNASWVYRWQVRQATVLPTQPPDRNTAGSYLILNFASARDDLDAGDAGRAGRHCPNGRAEHPRFGSCPGCEHGRKQGNVAHAGRNGGFRTHKCT